MHGQIPSGKVVSKRCGFILIQSGGVWLIQKNGALWRIWGRSGLLPATGLPRRQTQWQHSSRTQDS